MSELPRPRRPWDRTPAGEREYFDLLGGGLVALQPPRDRAPPGPGGWQPPHGGAWLHIGIDGRVRAFSGKVEVGQGTRTALALVVAEELRVPVGRVELVMGDTDLCPWDIGTFGSRSMPDAAPALASAAARALGELRAIAAARLECDPSEVDADEGEVWLAGRSPAISYGELVAGERRLVSADGQTAPGRPTGWSRAGRATIDPLAEEYVTGERRFGSDLSRPGMLHGAILWPPTHGARIRSLGDLPPPEGEARVVREGEFVGAVAGSAGAARALLRQLPVEWTASQLPGEAEIEGYLRSHPSTGDEWDREEDAAGDVDAAFAAAPVRLEATYRSAYVAHVPLEPHCALAEWTGDRATIWVGTQTPFRVRSEAARALGVPETDVRVIVPPTGSGFGGKHGGAVAIAAARLARAAGRPVRVAFDREEEFRHGYFRPMSLVDVRAAVDRSGRLVAWEFFNVNGGSASLLGPYRVPNRRVRNVLADSPLPQGSYRALAANPNTFARESAVDELARASGLDPLAFRERNLDDPRLLRVLYRAAERAGWATRTQCPGRGWGLAAGYEKGGRIATIAEVSVDGDRRLRVERLVSAFEAGAIVHPDNLRSQVEGAHGMALGGALFEAVHFTSAGVKNARLSEYRVPRFLDLPRIEVDLVDDREFPSAGAGESPMIAVAPAIANAIFDATGVRCRSLPLVPEGRVPSAGP